MPADMKFWVEFKFDYACCCVTIQSLTLGPSHKSTQCPSWTVFRLRPWEKVTSSQCYGDGVGVGPSQEGRTSNAPQLPWRSRGFLFFPVGCFWKSHDVFMPHPKIKGPSWYWPSKSYKQGPSLMAIVKMIRWKCLSPSNGNDEYVKVSISKFIWWSMLKLKVEGSLVRVPGIWGASVANRDSPFSFWIFIELAPSKVPIC